jgi:hypothetical protein
MGSPVPRRAAAAFVLAWFVWFSREGLFARFAPDDMMNLAGYWNPGVARSLLSNFTIGTNAYRPMGAVFYLPLFAAFGLNPLPYRIVIFVVLLANVYLAYRLARLLDCSELAAGLAALVVCYHAGLADLHYSTATVYDVLCFFFYCSSLIYYIRIRRQKRSLRKREWAAFFALFLCALNSKEMAVTLPVTLVIYEWLYQRDRELRPALAAGALTAVYILGKKFGADPLMAQEGYRPVFTLTRYFESSTLHLNELFYQGVWFTRGRALVLWLGMALTAWRVGRLEIRFAFLFLFIAPLPVVFLQGRTHSCLYLPLLGWAIFVAAAFMELVNSISRRPAARAALVGVAVLLLAWTTELHKRTIMPDYTRNGELTAKVIEQFRAANPRVAPGSWVLLVDDPFQDWDAKFIADLWFRDRSVTVWVQNKLRFSDQEIREKMTHIFRFENDRLVKLDVATYHALR